jgi:hypothetical protein
MKPSLALDPALLAIPAISVTEEQIATALHTLTLIAGKLREARRSCEFFLLQDVSTYLAAAGLYPSTMSISKLLTDMRLTQVYTTEDIRRSVNDILSRILPLEELSGVKFLIPSSFTSSPDIRGERTGDMLEALELTVTHVALAAQSRHQNVVQILIANSLINRTVRISADIDDIDPPLPRTGGSSLSKISNFTASLCTAASVDDFISQLEPEILWSFAENEAEIYFAIECLAYRLRQESGCHSPRDNCARFKLGSEFLTSLHSWQAISDGRYARPTLETCARLVAQFPKNKSERFFRMTSSGKNAEVVRETDKAAAWRTHISKEHEAMRLMYWQNAEGLIEFANIGPKSELKIC